MDKVIETSLADFLWGSEILNMWPTKLLFGKYKMCKKQILDAFMLICSNICLAFVLGGDQWTLKPVGYRVKGLLSAIRGCKRAHTHTSDSDYRKHTNTAHTQTNKSHTHIHSLTHTQSYFYAALVRTLIGFTNTPNPRLLSNPFQ